MITQAWDNIPKTVIKNGFKVLFKDIDQIELNLPSFHFSEDDDVPLMTLFNSFVDTEGNNDEVMDWAHGEEDGIPEDFSEPPNNEDIEIEQENFSGDQEPDLQNVVDSFRVAIDWCEKSNIPIQDILLLRRLRNKAVLARTT